MHRLITILVLTFLVCVASYWITIGMLNLAGWMGHGTFAGILAGWATIQFIVVALLGNNKSKRY